MQPQADPHAYLREYSALAREVYLNDIEGDVVEAGVYNGASLQAIAKGCPDRHVWAYDSFQGFPAGSLLDDDVARGLEGAVKGDPEEVRRALGGLYSALTIREGWFEDTFRLPLPERIAFLSVDCDLYESVFLTLRVLAPRVVPGGIITLDDWGAFIGCRRAFYHHVRNTRETPWLRNFGPCQAYWVVGE